MLFQRENPKGIDAGIHELQRDLYIQLTKYGWTDYDSFDRVYKNRKGDDKIPEAYVGKGEYKEVLYNDKKHATSFFLVEDERNYDYEKFLWSQNISIIFQVNLSKIFPDVNHQADEELIDQIKNAIHKKFWDNRITKVITGIEKVYSSLKLSYNKKDFADMGNYGIVRFDFKMFYSNENCVHFIK